MFSKYVFIFYRQNNVRLIPLSTFFYVSYVILTLLYYVVLHTIIFVVNRDVVKVYRVIVCEREEAAFQTFSQI